MPLLSKVNAAKRQVYNQGRVQSLQKLALKKESGRGPPTSPTLRPRVLTPRDHFAHRGGGRAMIMHKSSKRCNREYWFFSRSRDANFVAKAGLLLVIDPINLFVAKRTQYCAARRSPDH